MQRILRRKRNDDFFLSHLVAFAINSLFSAKLSSDFMRRRKNSLSSFGGKKSSLVLKSRVDNIVMYILSLFATTKPFCCNEFPSQRGAFPNVISIHYFALSFRKDTRVRRPKWKKLVYILRRNFRASTPDELMHSKNQPRHFLHVGCL